MQSFDREITEAVRLARAAGKILLQVRQTDFKVDYKQGWDPVTEADTRANALIVEGLRQHFPQDLIIAEESPRPEGSAASSRTWFVDPLDGTREYVAKRDDFAVMIGLAIDGEAQLGVVYQPLRDKLYRGAVGHGAYLECQGQTSTLVVSEIDQPQALRLVVSRSHRSKKTDNIKERLGIQQEMLSGSVGIKIGLVAEQQADLYVHVSDKSSVWDTCGPEAILKAAGGCFTDVLGQPFSYANSGETFNRLGIVACNRKVFDQVIHVVRDVARETGFLDQAHKK